MQSDEEEIHDLPLRSIYQEPQIGMGGWFIVAGITVIFAITIRAFLFQSFKIPSASMEPTLLIGDHILVDKFSYGLYLPGVKKPLYRARFPRRGDVIVFYKPEDQTPKPLSRERHYIKRLVGIPGDSVEVRGFSAYVNGERVDNPETTRLTSGNMFADPPSVTFGPVQLKEDQFFVLGDNRINSEDSRVFGPIHLRQIEGRAVVIYWSWRIEKAGIGVRWERIGKKIQ